MKVPSACSDPMKRLRMKPVAVRTSIFASPKKAETSKSSLSTFRLATSSWPAAASRRERFERPRPWGRHHTLSVVSGRCRTR